MRGISKTRRVQAQLNDFKNLGMDGRPLFHHSFLMFGENKLPDASSRS